MLQYINALAKKYLQLFSAQTKLLELSILHGSFNQRWCEADCRLRKSKLIHADRTDSKQTRINITLSFELAADEVVDVEV